MPHHGGYRSDKNMDRMEWMAEKVTEMGVDRIVPLLCRYSERKVLKTERLRKILVAAMKQSLKATLPQLDDLTPFDDFMKALPDGQRFIAYCDPAIPRRDFVKECLPKSDVTILVGPEGDFSQPEIRAALDAGFIPVSLGDSRLRTETAGVFACAAIHTINQLKNDRTTQKLCLRQLLPARRPLRDRGRTDGYGHRRTNSGNHPSAGHPLRVQRKLPKGEPLADRLVYGHRRHKGARSAEKVGQTYNIPVVTDIHAAEEAAMAAEYVDVLQIPAFLCRQTDLLVAAARTGKTVNIKKGQFLSPEAMEFAVQKVKDAGNNDVAITERGTTFGYQDLIVDYRGIPTMRRFAPVILDVTHSLQQPNQTCGVTGGLPHLIETMARCGIAAGVDGLFMETHQNPAVAKSDGANMLPLDRMEGLLERLSALRMAVNEINR